ncbi:META domain-containing protein [Thalassotalea fusca]
MLNYSNKVVSVIISVLVILSNVGCANQLEKTAQMEQINVKVKYLDRSMLPKGSTLTVSLIDVSLADAESTTITEITQESITAPPYHVSLDYDVSSIKQGHSYSIRAVIYHQDKLLYTSTSTTDPFAQRLNQHIDITVDKVRYAPVSKPSYSALNGEWKIKEVYQMIVGTDQLRKLPYLKFDERGFQGFSGCNGINGIVVHDKEGIRFTHIASTMMLCQDTANDLESQINKALYDVRRFSIEAKKLLLKDESNNVVMQLERV